jgi:hypothetical protein
MLTGSSIAGHMAGGTSAMDISDDRLQKAVHAVTPQFQAMAQAQGRNGMVSQLEIVEAQSQVVAGINYFVKVRGSRHAFAFAAKSVPETCTVSVLL